MFLENNKTTTTFQKRKKMNILKKRMKKFKKKSEKLDLQKNCLMILIKKNLFVLLLKLKKNLHFMNQITLHKIIKK